MHIYIVNNRVLQKSEIRLSDPSLISGSRQYLLVEVIHFKPQLN
jgi:hypothetical protein